MKRSFSITLALIAAIAVPLCASSGWARGLGVAGLAGAEPMDAGRTVLPPPMRLAWASEGTVSDAIARAITEAVARYEVFTESFQSWLSYTAGLRLPSRCWSQHRLAMYVEVDEEISSACRKAVGQRTGVQALAADGCAKLWGCGRYCRNSVVALARWRTAG